MQKLSLTYLTVFLAGLALSPAAALAGGTSGHMNYEGVMKTIPYTKIEFKPGSAILSDSDRMKLHDLVADAADQGAIRKINVAAWSDKPFPRDRKLFDADRELADLRADNIRMCLRNEIKTANVDTFSMAEDTNWLGRLFKTDDSELKSVFSKKGAAAPVTNAEYRIIKNEGGPSYAVIVVEQK